MTCGPPVSLPPPPPLPPRVGKEGRKEQDLIIGATLERERETATSSPPFSSPSGLEAHVPPPPLPLKWHLQEKGRASPLLPASPSQQLMQRRRFDFNNFPRKGSLEQDFGRSTICGSNYDLRPCFLKVNLSYSTPALCSDALSSEDDFLTRKGREARSHMGETNFCIKIFSYSTHAPSTAFSLLSHSFSSSVH